MAPCENVKIVSSFPDPYQGRYDRDQWIHDHGQSNVIINCYSKQIFYPDHWTPLSLKCSFGGKEFYRSGNAIQCTSDDHFLIYNQGKEYTSFINSDTEVESFSINFSAQFVNNVCNGLFLSVENNLDDPAAEKIKNKVNFFERTYTYTTRLRQQVFSIRELAKEDQQDKECINEMLLGLLESLISFRENIDLEVNELYAVKESTRKEIYKRLHLVKDLLDSSYQSNITLDTLAKASLLNSFYMLRLFKSYFKITPYQYLKQRRIEEAVKLLQNKNYSVSQVCSMVGFSDISSFSKLFKKETGSSPGSFSPGDIENKKAGINPVS